MAGSDWANDHLLGDLPICAQTRRTDVGPADDGCPGLQLLPTGGRHDHSRPAIFDRPEHARADALSSPGLCFPYADRRSLSGQTCAEDACLALGALPVAG